DPSRAGVLLRRGVPPAVPREESRRLLRPRRHRCELPDRRRRDARIRDVRRATCDVRRATCGRTTGISLPIDLFIPAIGDHVRHSGAVVVTAAPGAGKTTRIPPALVDEGAVILLQPRRAAARAIARRIADERGWTLGREIGWQIRFERRFSGETRLLVA